MSRGPRIRVAIDRLVLRGVDPADAAAVRRALAAELGRRLATGPTPEGRSAAHLRAQVRFGPDAAGTGRAAGAAIAGALAGKPRR